MNIIRLNPDELNPFYANGRRPTQFENIKSVLYADEWSKHPLYTNYYISKRGNLVYNQTTENISYGTVNKLGYIMMHLKRSGKDVKASIHRLKWEAWNNKIIPKGYEIDHKDDDCTNNNLDNLQLLTKSEHARKTHRSTNKRKKRDESRCVSGRAVKDGFPTIYFKSLAEAEMKIYGKTVEQVKHTRGGNISRYLKTGKSKPYGYDIILDTYPNLEGEVWKRNTNLGYYSNMGRVKAGIYAKPFYGHPSSYDNNRLHFNGSEVSIMVCKLFNGKKPGPGYTVDHINRNTRDNRACNLRWATYQQQNRNKRNNIQLEMFNFYTNEVLLTGVLQDVITNISRGSSLTYTEVMTLQWKKRDWLCRPVNISAQLKKLNYFKHVHTFLREFKGYFNENCNQMNLIGPRSKTSRRHKGMNNPRQLIVSRVVNKEPTIQVWVPFTKFYKSHGAKQFTRNFQIKKYESEDLARLDAFECLKKHLAALTIQTYYRCWKSTANQHPPCNTSSP
jgi:hypothetical protein